MGTRRGRAVTTARARVKWSGVKHGRRDPWHTRTPSVGDVLEEVIKELLRQSARWRHTGLALGVTSELAFLALEALEKVLLTNVAASWLESLGESVGDHVGHRSVDGDIEAIIARP